MYGCTAIGLVVFFAGTFVIAVAGGGQEDVGDLLMMIIIIGVLWLVIRNWAPGQKIGGPSSDDSAERGGGGIPGAGE